MDKDDLQYIPPRLRRPLDNDDKAKPNDSLSKETDNIGPDYIQPHPIADMFPRMQGKDFADLVTSIKEYGLEEPIVTFEEKILDGRNRYAACTEAEVAPEFDEYEGTDPLGFVLRKNLHRRQLQTSQRALIAARMANLPQGGDHKSGDFKTSIDGLKIDDAAEILNVSPKTIERAKTVLASGDDKLIEAVESGEVSVSAAANKISPPGKPTGTPLTDAEEQCQKLLKLWDKAGDEGQALFLKAIRPTT